MKIETVIALIELGIRSAPSVAEAIAALQQHSGKNIQAMSETEMLSAAQAFRVKTPQELIAEGMKEG